MELHPKPPENVVRSQFGLSQDANWTKLTVCKKSLNSKYHQETGLSS